MLLGEDVVTEKAEQKKTCIKDTSDESTPEQWLKKAIHRRATDDTRFKFLWL